MSGQPVWATRIGSGLDATFEAYSQTAEEDVPFIPHDLDGSAAHVAGLEKAGLVDAEEAIALLGALRDVAAQHAAGTFVLDPGLEDVHMNIEAALTATLGDLGKKLHTGRSRNDQVATCITLYSRASLVKLAEQAHRLGAVLASQAEQHKATPWVAKTHGQPAQPATLGFLLSAHAFRFCELAKQVLQTFQAIAESPLGSGAVAGSTLPLDPAFTAGKLGLRPPRNALLATGTRDSTLKVLQVTSTAGIYAASLAQDLLDLFHAKAVKLPPGFTSGSSLMPHKRNPDALELVRGKGKALPGLYSQATGLVAGLGLGYQRDLQATKPLLVSGLEGATDALQILAGALQGAVYDADVLAEDLHKPGITATDAAEALVAQGMPFRAAYAVLAEHARLVEEGEDPVAAVSDLLLTPEQAQAVCEALVPDAARRATLGGPAPSAVQAALENFDACHATVATLLESATTDIEKPKAWLEVA